MQTVNIFTRLSPKRTVIVIVWLVVCVALGYIFLSRKFTGSGTDDFIESSMERKKKRKK